MGKSSKRPDFDRPSSDQPNSTIQPDQPGLIRWSPPTLFDPPQGRNTLTPAPAAAAARARRTDRHPLMFVLLSPGYRGTRADDIRDFIEPSSSSARLVGASVRA
jgi:hypothetical protein